MQIDPNAPTGAAAGSAPSPSVQPALSSQLSEYEAYKAQKTESLGQSGSIGFKGASLAYRKIGEAHAGLEVDPLFSAFQSKALFHDICQRAYGKHAAISPGEKRRWCATPLRGFPLLHHGVDHSLYTHKLTPRRTAGSGGRWTGTP